MNLRDTIVTWFISGFSAFALPTHGPYVSTRRYSRAASERERRGRAGRTVPGHLWTISTDLSRTFLEHGETWVQPPTRYSGMKSIVLRLSHFNYVATEVGSSTLRASSPERQAGQAYNGALLSRGTDWVWSRRLGSHNQGLFHYFGLPGRLVVGLEWYLWQWYFKIWKRAAFCNESQITPWHNHVIQVEVRL